MAAASERDRCSPLRYINYEMKPKVWMDYHNNGGWYNDCNDTPP